MSINDLDTVCIIDPKTSLINIIQIISRALRKSPGKEFGTIIIPVFIQPGDDAESVILASNFSAVYNVLNALKEQDEAMSQEIDAIRTKMGRDLKYKANINDLTKVTAIPLLSQETIDRYSTIDSSFCNSLSAYLVEECTASWDFMFGLLEAFVDKNEHALVPVTYDENGYNLGTWVVTQRQLKNKSKIDKATLDKINKLGDLKNVYGISVWSWDLRYDNWYFNYTLLKEYMAIREDGYIHKDYTTESGVKLGMWAGKQRRELKSNKDSKTQERIDSLNNIENIYGEKVWCWDDRYDKWYISLSLLQHYIDINGNAQVSRGYVTDCGFKLGKWVDLQRQLISKGGQDVYTMDKIKSLNELKNYNGDNVWIWDTYGHVWNIGLGHLQFFIDNNHHAQVQRGYITENGYPLGNWVKHQRRLISKIVDGDLIIKTKVNRLNALENNKGENVWTWESLK